MHVPRERRGGMAEGMLNRSSASVHLLSGRKRRPTAGPTSSSQAHARHSALSHGPELFLS